jgi:flagellar M-ring protein FliF
MALSPVPTPSEQNALIAQARGAVSHVLRMADQPALRRAMPAILILLVTVGALGIWALLREPVRVPLFPGMAEADKAAVMSALTTAGINARIDATTGEVQVPQADYHSAKMQLAAQGLPQAVPDGNQVLTDLPMGASRSVEAARLRQAQETDLARSITEISTVAGARVHLALPEKSAFLRDSQAPRASVFLQLAAGRVMEPAQVEAVVNLVSSSIPGMARADVTVVDQMGRLLSRGSDDPGALAGDRQLEQRMRMEQLYRQRIEALLTPIAGAGNLSVEVTVDMDFTQSQITEERVDPNGSALRSEQAEMTESATPAARGIPGAVSNTPPGPAALTSQGPTATGQGTPAATGAPVNRSSGTTRNFEVSRTVATTHPAGAQIKRISAAILMRATPPKDGAEDTPLLDPALQADLEKLAQTAIGFDADRGDSVTILAQPFRDEAVSLGSGGTDLSWMPEALRQIALVAVLAIVALGIVRPLLTRGFLAGSAGGSGTLAYAGMRGVEVADGDSLDDVQARLESRRARLTATALGATATRDEKFAVLRQIATEDPARIAAVLQRMMKDEIDNSLS